MAEKDFKCKDCVEYYVEGAYISREKCHKHHYCLPYDPVDKKWCRSFHRRDDKEDDQQTIKKKNVLKYLGRGPDRFISRKQ